MYVVPDHQSESGPDLWQALADPTRRLLIDRLADGAKTTSQLCDGIPMSRFGVMKHLGVLERAGLVIGRRHGRLRYNHLNAAPLHALQSRWLSGRATRWGRIGSDLAALATEEGMNSPSDAKVSVADVALEWTVAASVQRLWRALFDAPGIWWPEAHKALGKNSEMTFDERLGGALKEEDSSGAGITWYTVYAIAPMRSVDLTGHLAARYGGPATSFLHLEITAGAAEGTSVLKLTDSVFGQLGPDFRRSLTSGWQAILGEGLGGHLDAGEN